MPSETRVGYNIPNSYVAGSSLFPIIVEVVTGQAGQSQAVKGAEVVVVVALGLKEYDNNNS